jgi:hypothetical protein
VVGQHGDPPADRDPVERAGQGPLQHLQLRVDLDAQRLEGALRRVAAGPPGRRGDRGAHQVGEPGRRRERRLGPLGDDGGRDPPGERLLAVAAQDSGERGLVIGVEHVGRGAPGRRVHPHVQRRVAGVGETAVVEVQLQRGDAEVEQHRVDGRDAEPVEDGGNLVVDGVRELDPADREGEPLAAGGERLRVPVQADEP